MKITEETHCQNMAEFILPWGGKLLKYCEIHANQICAIADAIGSPIEVERTNLKTRCQGANDVKKI